MHQLQLALFLMNTLVWISLLPFTNVAAEAARTTTTTTTEGNELSITPESILYSRRVVCPASNDDDDNDAVMGYTSIQDMNADQEDEYVRISKRHVIEQPTYAFVLCEGTVFDANREGPIIVSLNGSMFKCGKDSDIVAPSTECVVSGGTEQVIISGSIESIDNDENHHYYKHRRRANIIHVEFHFIFFETFTRTSIIAQSVNAQKKSSSSAVTFRRCRWRNFDSRSIIRVKNQRVEIYDAMISNGMGESLFVNNGGELFMNRVGVGSVDASTFVISSNNGESIVENSMFTQSYLSSVIAVSGHATQTMRGTSIYEMTFLGNIFQVLEEYDSQLVFNVSDVVKDFIEATWRHDDDPNQDSDDAISTAEIKFSRFLPYPAAKKLFTTTVAEAAAAPISNNIGKSNARELGLSQQTHAPPTTNAMAFAIEATITMKQSLIAGDRKFSSQVFESGQDGYFTMEYLFLETV